MAGVKGKSGGPRKNSGGARAGAGRKPKPKAVPVPVKQDGRDMLLLLQDVAMGLVDATPTQVRAAIASLVLGSPPMRISSYFKLRVGPASLARELTAASLSVRETRALPGGVHVLLAVKEKP